jgi:hypothetical protein
MYLVTTCASNQINLDDIDLPMQNRCGGSPRLGAAASKRSLRPARSNETGLLLRNASGVRADFPQAAIEIKWPCEAAKQKSRFARETLSPARTY